VAGHAFLLVVFERGVPSVAEASDLLLVVHAGQGRRNHAGVGGVAIVVESLRDLGGVHPVGGLVCGEDREDRVRVALLLRGGGLASKVKSVFAREFLELGADRVVDLPGLVAVVGVVLAVGQVGHHPVIDELVTVRVGRASGG